MELKGRVPPPKRVPQEITKPPLPTTTETKMFFALGHVRLLLLALLFKIGGGRGPHAHITGDGGRHWRGDQDMTQDKASTQGAFGWPTQPG
jgi:hypothetical protein